ncbi:LemA family protein [bacterium]|nr:LemA family protein [bacterium]
MSNYIVIGVVLVFFVAVTVLFNRGIKLKNYVNEAFSTMDVYLKKRWDLIPNLVECVKEYSGYEKTILKEVTDIRTKNYSSMSLFDKLDANLKINDVIPKFFALAENYPDLKANQNYMKLMDELTKVEDDIANARKYYNGTVRELNTFTETFPSNIVCMIFGIRQAKLFEIDDTERNNVKLG